jgi:hypothetical protein
MKGGLGLLIFLLHKIIDGIFDSSECKNLGTLENTRDTFSGGQGLGPASTPLIPQASSHDTTGKILGCSRKTAGASPRHSPDGGCGQIRSVDCHIRDSAPPPALMSGFWPSGED